MLLPDQKVNVLLLGSGGREAALAQKLHESPHLQQLYIAPGNGGTIKIAQTAAINMLDADEIAHFCAEKGVSLVVIGPEAPLVEGVADVLRAQGIAVFGPGKQAAQMEGSKAFSKHIMQKAGVSTAPYKSFDNKEDALAYLDKIGAPCVVKADGLAAGKGVFIAQTLDEARDGVEQCFDGAFGESGNSVVIEEMLSGPECSFLVLCDGTHIKPLAFSQDHKRAYEGDTGPNTGGMGVYSPVPIVTEDEALQMLDAIQKTVDTLRAEGIQFKGCLYGGFMLTKDGPKILEFNARFGDPETQVIIPRMKCDLVEALLACDTEELNQVQIDWDPRYAVSVVLCSEGYPGSYQTDKTITGIEDAEAMDDVIVYHAGTRLEPGGRLVTAGGRVLNVVALGDTFEQARDLCYKALNHIQFEGKTYRKDIGEKALKGRIAWGE